MVVEERYQIINMTRGVELATSATMAANFTSRLIGLLNRSSLLPGEGLIIKPCKSVHTFLMRFPIDVLFLDGAGIIVDMYAEMPPNRVSQFVSAAQLVIELPAGTALQTLTLPGHQIEIQPIITSRRNSYQ